MDARFQYVKMDKSQGLEEFSQKKLDKLEDKYDFIKSSPTCAGAPLLWDSLSSN